MEYAFCPKPEIIPIFHYGLSYFITVTGQWLLILVSLRKSDTINKQPQKPNAYLVLVYLYRHK